LGDGQKQVSNEGIVYQPGNKENKTDAALYFNLTGSPSIACTLLHHEDDWARTGFYFATDSGNDVKGNWGKGGIHTFMLSRENALSYVFDNNANYQILCVK